MEATPENKFERYRNKVWRRMDQSERQAVAQEHLDRARQGKGVWNAWAKELKDYIQSEGIVGFKIRFNGLKVNGNLKLNGYLFPCAASFSNAVFADDVIFSHVKFVGVVSFKEAVFCGEAQFGNSEFCSSAYFSKTRFEKGGWFTEAWFGGLVLFDGTQFEGLAKFERVEFTTLPSFNGAHFNEGPNLGAISIPEDLVSDESRTEWQLVEGFRKLKQMSIQGGDHESEIRFFGLELHAKALLKTTPWYQWLIIKIYYWFSNFGQSLIRPVLAIVFFLGLMFVINGHVIQPSSDSCRADPATFNRHLAVYTLSAATPFININRTQELEMRACLFGSDILWPKHYLWRALHLLPTTFLIFLFGLAVRNQFKIR